VIAHVLHWLKGHPVSLFLSSLVIAVVVVVSCTGGNKNNMMTSPSMGTVAVSISDPPSCAGAVGAAAKSPGTFSNVWITIVSVKAHISAAADPGASGWQELAPQLNSAPVQLDLLNLPANGQCLLQQLGSASLPSGDYQQIRLILLANAATSMAPSANACASLGNVFNCVKDSNGLHALDLSSEAKTGLKIPPGQIMGGPLHVAADQSVDLNIDFNTCASLVAEGNGDFRLKPTLRAGVVSPNMTGISGQIVDSVTLKPISGATVTLQSQVAETAATTGASTGPGTIQGVVTAVNGTTGASIDATLSALQTVTISSASRTFTVPPFQNPASLTIQVSSSGSCPMGSPTGAFCGSYSLIVPASNPNVGTISAGKVTYTAPTSGDVLYTVEADATNATSNAAICSPSSQTTSKDLNGMPLKVTPGATTNAARIDFSGCS